MVRSLLGINNKIYFTQEVTLVNLYIEPAAREYILHQKRADHAIVIHLKKRQGTS